MKEKEVEIIFNKIISDLRPVVTEFDDGRYLGMMLHSALIKEYSLTKYKLSLAIDALKRIDEDCSRHDTTAWLIASNCIEDIEALK